MTLWRSIRTHLHSWSFLAFVFVVAFALPPLALWGRMFQPISANEAHIAQYLLLDMVMNTGFLVIVVGGVTALLGVSVAWLMTGYDFPGRTFWRWALLLPLAIPPYIAAYTYYGMTNYTGTIQTTLRAWGIMLPPASFDMMTLPGAAFIFSICLFPYVYSLCYVFFGTRCATMVENARLLGSSAGKLFWRIMVPLARTAIAAGVGLVMLEVLNDYGVAKYYGIVTVTSAIFQIWFGMGDLASAVRLALGLMVVIAFVMAAERWLRGRRQYKLTTSKARPLRRIPLRGVRAWACALYCGGLFACGFAFPVIQLLMWAWRTHANQWNVALFIALGHSLTVALIGSLFIVVMATVIANVSRLHPNGVTQWFVRITLFGYSMPGAVVAVGVITVFVTFDAWLRRVLVFLQGASHPDVAPALWISSTLVMLMCGYLVRFVAVGYHAIDAGFTRLGKGYTEASRTLGYSITRTFFFVEFPLMRRAMLTALVLCFVDLVKELPLTLLLQPFNFPTLATLTFHHVHDERIQDAAVASLGMIALCVGGMLVLQHILEKEKKQ